MAGGVLLTMSHVAVEKIYEYLQVQNSECLLL